MYIKNRRNSSKFKGCSSLQLLRDLIGKCDEVAYFSRYTNRCHSLRKTIIYEKKRRPIDSYNC